jgi:hypothetical protein
MGAVLAAGTSIVAILFRQQRGNHSNDQRDSPGSNIEERLIQMIFMSAATQEFFQAGRKVTIGRSVTSMNSDQVVDVTSVRSSSQTDGGETTSVERQTVFLMPAQMIPFHPSAFCEERCWARH